MLTHILLDSDIIICCFVCSLCDLAAHTRRTTLKQVQLQAFKKMNNRYRQVSIVNLSNSFIKMNVIFNSYKFLNYVFLFHVLLIYELLIFLK